MTDDHHPGLFARISLAIIAISALVEKINEGRNNINLSSAIRVFVFNHYRPINGKEAKQNPHSERRSLLARAGECRAGGGAVGGAGHLIECGDFTRCPCLQCLFQASNKGAIVKGLFQVPECSGFQHARRIFSLSKAVMKIVGVKLPSAINCA